MEKRKQSCLIPFYREGDEVYVFLQKRSKTAKQIPGYFGFWGGGIEEGESAEEGLKREIKEELGIDLPFFEFFCLYEFYGSIKNFYTSEVSKDFESQIIIGEGDYGKFFMEDEIQKEDKLINEDRVVLGNFFGKMKRDNPFEA